MIHENTFLGEVTLIVKNIERSISFYTETLGFQFSKIRPGEVVLFSNKEHPLLILKEDVKPKKCLQTRIWVFTILLYYTQIAKA